MKKSFKSFICFFLVFTLASQVGKSQSYNRIRADFTVKSKTSTGSQSLTVGQVFYDRNIKQLIYYLTFPDSETWITADTLVFLIKTES